MPNEVKKTLHFHIGPDRVYERLFELVFGSLSETRGVYYVSGDDYRKHLRDLVDGGHHDKIASVLRQLSGDANTIAVSRPRLLYDGSPMNLAGGSSLYKLDSIQKGFRDYNLIFHIFLTDHLGYLVRSNPDSPSLSGKEFSWLPLIRSVSGMVSGDNRLLAWPAEGKEFIQTFISRTTGSVGTELDNLAASVLRSEKVPAPEAEERYAQEAGLDAYELDAAFEEDLEKIG